MGLVSRLFFENLEPHISQPPVFSHGLEYEYLPLPIQPKKDGIYIFPCSTQLLGSYYTWNTSSIPIGLCTYGMYVHMDMELAKKKSSKYERYAAGNPTPVSFRIVCVPYYAIWRGLVCAQSVLQGWIVYMKIKFRNPQVDYHNDSNQYSYMTL